MKNPSRKVQNEDHDIAIIGMDGIFPQSSSIDQFWLQLCEGKELVTFFTDDDLLAAGIPSALLQDPNYIKASPTIEDYDKFDADFFKYSIREATALDPQQRFLLQCAWRTLEHAGYAPNDIAQRVGVFAGAGGTVTSYLLEYEKSYPEIRGTTGSFQHLGNDKDFLTTRVSYKLNLRGPSLDIQTACSTSLVTVHLACQSILNGECEMALAGGVNIRVPHIAGYMHQDGGIYSADGHCRSFDANATGIVFGSGVGLVLLKPLKKALEDHDTVYAVIKGSAINNDGGTKVSYTASSANGQSACMKDAFEKAGISPETVQYVEAHGTGTAMGDPVEITALTNVFKDFTDKKQFCAIGTVKANVGHLDTAAGIAGLIKTILCLHYKKIPPIVNFESPNPRIDFKNSPFYINTTLKPWDDQGIPRRAAVNSLGMGGTNAFIILEEAPSIESDTNPLTDDISDFELLTISAKTDTTLKALASKYLDFIDSHSDSDLSDICKTTQIGRAHFSNRLAIITNSLQDLNRCLTSFIENDHTNNLILNNSSPEGKRINIVFQFTNSESAFNVNWDDIFKNSPVLKLIASNCNLSCLQILHVPISELLVSSVEMSHIHLANYVKNFLISKLYLSFGIKPKVCIADYLNIISALAIADIITFEDGLSIIARHETKTPQKKVNIKDSSVKIFAYSGIPEDILSLFKESIHITSKNDIQNIVSDHEISISLVISNSQSCGDTDNIYPEMSESNDFSWLSLLQVIASLYVHGVTIDWASFGEAKRGKRIALPTYPFQKNRYWVESNASISNKSQIEKDINLLYELIWKVVNNASTNSHPQKRTWLILTNCHKRLEPLKMKLQDRKDECLIIDDISLKDVTSKEDIVSILKKYHSGNTITDIIFYFIDYPGNESLVLSDVINKQKKLFSMLLHAIPFLLNEKWKDLPTMWLFTKGIQPIDSNTVNLTYAPIFGFYQTFRLEYADWPCRYIDLDPTANLSENTEYVLHELSIADGNDRIAYRKGTRYAQRLIPALSNISPNQAPSEKNLCTANGCYLITGGTGALGYLLLEWLIHEGATHFVLIARREPKPDFIKKISALRDRNNHIDIISVDVSNESEIDNLITQFGKKWPPLKGIIHAAGTLADATLLEQNWENFESIWKSKVIGAWNLHQATVKQKINLDFFILYSSIASALGSAGQINYASANSYLDALAVYRHQHGLPALSVNWGPWGNVGMAAKHARLHLQRGWHPLLPAKAFAALKVAMTGKNPQVIIADIDWPIVLANQPRDASWLGELVQPTVNVVTTGSDNIMDRLKKAPAHEQEALLYDHVCGLLKTALGLAKDSQINSDQGFFDMGLDSLLAVALRGKLQESLQPDSQLPRTLLFEHSNLSKLMTYLKTEALSSFFNLNSNKLPSESATIPMTESGSSDGSNPIAIIGIGCRFPSGANNPRLFWNILENGIDAISEVPSDRWENSEYYDSNLSSPGKISTKYGGFLNTPIKDFDAYFFNISPREAEMIDPQHRLLLEVTWEALEDAAIPAIQLMGSSTGVFVGISTRDFDYLIQKADVESSDFNAYYAIGNLASASAGRLAYFFGLQGPTFAIDTACSSSLVAIHEACQSLRSNTCQMAIASAVNLMLSPDISISVSKAGMLAPDGRCKTFDARADGYVRSEGCGAVILKKLQDAERDGDRIYGIIRGTAINQGGRSGGITVPNGQAQEAVIKQALSDARLSADAISYVESHGTGTKIGDPIEINALKKVYGAVSRKHPLKIGAVKSNIGHAEAAAGMAGLMKVLLAFENEVIPPDLHIKDINPMIDLPAFPAEIPTDKSPWPRDRSHTRIAGISSFGFAGSNAHLVVEEAKNNARKLQLTEPSSHIFALSAKSPEALQDLIRKYKEFTAQNKHVPLGDIAYTANTGRNHFEYRVAIVARSHAELYEKLSQINVKTTKHTKSEPVIFVVNKDGNDANTIPVIENLFLSWNITPAHTINLDQDSIVEHIKKGYKLFLEIGTVSSASIRESIIDIFSENQCQWILSLTKDNNDNWYDILLAIAKLYANGVNINWNEIYKPLSYNKISLPTYPFQRKTCWPKALNLVLNRKHRSDLNANDKPDKKSTIPTKNIIKQAFSKSLGISENDIDENADFFELGLDSIMTAEAMSFLKSNLPNHISLPPSLPYQHSSIAKLNKEIELLINDSDKWFKTLNIGDGSNLQLFLFPYAGGGATMFSGWNKQLENNISLNFLQLPGREARSEEQPITQFTMLVDKIAEALSKKVSGHFIIFGYSLGAIIAYEVAKKLYSTYQLQPDCLIVAAMCSPKLFSTKAQSPTVSKDEIVSILQKQYDEALRENNKNVTTDKTIMDTILKPLNHDIDLANNYQYDANVILNCPIVAFAGSKDALYNINDVAAWESMTNDNFKLIKTHGNHFSMAIHYDQLTNFIREITISGFSSIKEN